MGIHVTFTETLNNTRKIEDISDTLLALYQGIRGHVPKEKLMFHMDVE